MATDIFSNEVGTMTVINASMSKISTDKSTGICLGANIQYTCPINPIASFGSDVLYVRAQPQGSFSLQKLAADVNLFASISAGDCQGTTLSIKFESDDNCNATINGQKITGTRSIPMEGVFWNSFQMQGQAQDAYFLANVGGVFHYIPAGK